MDFGQLRYARNKKKRKWNRILNILIAVILFFNAFLVYKIFFDKPSEETVQEENLDTEPEMEEDEEELLDDAEKESDENGTDEPATEIEEKWEPIGTVQEEPFVAVFEKDHVNWQEMTRALQYATGLGDEMIIWWLGNGGDHQSAVGIVSTGETKNTPLKVRLEWVTNRGWKPVSVEELDENPYLSQ